MSAAEGKQNGAAIHRIIVMHHFPETARAYRLRIRLRDLANQRRRFGYGLFILLGNGASHVNRIYRLYRQEGLTVRKRKARRKAIGTGTPILMRPRSTRADCSTSDGNQRASSATMCKPLSILNST